MMAVYRPQRKTISTQTEINTLTFIEILNINKQKQAHTKSTAVQAVRYQGDLSYLYKRYGVHIADFGQSVNPAKIKREFEIFDVEQKNKRIFQFEQRGPMPGSKVKVHEHNTFNNQDIEEKDDDFHFVHVIHEATLNTAKLNDSHDHLQMPSIHVRSPKTHISVDASQSTGTLHYQNPPSDHEGDGENSQLLTEIDKIVRETRRDFKN